MQGLNLSTFPEKSDGGGVGGSVTRFDEISHFGDFSKFMKEIKGIFSTW